MIPSVLRDRQPEASVRAAVGHVDAVEGLRGVAVLGVIAFHYWVLRNGTFADPWVDLVNSAGPLRVWVAHGYLGVDLFFLITGFLLTLPWLRNALEGREAPSTRDFYVRRVRRIVPAYYAHLAVLGVVFIPLVFGAGYYLRNLYYLGYNIPAHLAFLHYLTPTSSNSLNLNGALWTLALEAQYYLLLPLLAPLFVRAPWRTTLASLAIAAAWRWLAAHDLRMLVDMELIAGGHSSVTEPVVRHLLATQLPGYLGHFAVGVVIGRAWLLMRSRPGRGSTPYWLIVAFMALYILHAVHSSLPNLFGELTWMVIPLALGIVMHALLTGAPRAAALLLANRPLAFVGRVSYSAYLYHLPLLLAWNLHAPGELGWAGAPAFLALTLLVAWLSYRLVERPFLPPRPASRPTWPTSAAPGASPAPSTSPTTTASGGERSTTSASSSSS